VATSKRKLVYVHWVDACSHDSWQNIHHITPAVLDSYTVGYLVAENNDAVSVASTINDSNDACCIMHIPKKWIKERGTLNIETKQRKKQRKDLPAVGEGSDHIEVSFGE
jgi:hypothetical protein